MLIGETACSYALLILEDDKIPATADKITTLLKSAKVEVESFWPSLFAKLDEKKNIRDLISSAAGAAAAAPAAEEKKKEEPAEESDDDMGFSLFD
ncbi:large ribosomal subunit protein P1z isoform X2 [Cicer arietinum]|uniref:60S acidic ribosomal protein P1-1 isoform X2 n=1 Tax=Cicer arietinum TaxID=3827 RepID=A0A3Q7X399_CICAR|nr:60S acidic ribosomal protein P1-1 isoform X2 [Cicer arietinum]